MAHLGHMFANGAGVAASNASALRWFQQGAERGHASALYGLGYLHLAGFGVPKDPASALHFFSAAAKEVNHPSSLRHLGSSYGGLHCCVTRLYRVAANCQITRATITSVLLGSQLAPLHLASMVLERTTTYRGCLRLVVQSCVVQGHTEAYFHLGVMHLNGWGVRASPAQALQYFSQAARNGHLLAQYNLAMMHLSGTAADKCVALACTRNHICVGFMLPMLSRGARICIILLCQKYSGNPLWMLRAGCMAALELLKKVAERGPRAAVLGEAYEWYSAGAEEEALAAYLRAGELGLEVGQSNAAWLLARGHGPVGSAAGRLALKMHQRAAGQVLVLTDAVVLLCPEEDLVPRSCYCCPYSHCFQLWHFLHE